MTNPPETPKQEEVAQSLMTPLIERENVACMPLTSSEVRHAYSSSLSEADEGEAQMLLTSEEYKAAKMLVEHMSMATEYEQPPPDHTLIVPAKQEHTEEHARGARQVALRLRSPRIVVVGRGRTDREEEWKTITRVMGTDEKGGPDHDMQQRLFVDPYDRSTDTSRNVLTAVHIFTERNILNPHIALTQSSTALRRALRHFESSWSERAAEEGLPLLDVHFYPSPMPHTFALRQGQSLNDGAKFYLQEAVREVFLLEQFGHAGTIVLQDGDVTDELRNAAHVVKKALAGKHTYRPRMKQLDARNQEHSEKPLSAIDPLT